MRIQILSDLHLDIAPMDLPRTDADVVVLAGDIGNPMQAVEWAQGFSRPVLYVPGNHEFWDAELEGTLEALRARCRAGPVTLLDRDEVVLGGVRFLGATLWTDYRVYEGTRPLAGVIEESRLYMRDFIRIRARGGGLLTPEHLVGRFEADRAFIEARLAQPHAGPTVVVTHHAPSPRSIHPRFAGLAFNAAYASDLESLFGADRVALWVHGHTHDGFDYVVNGTRVLCNPRGYARDGVAQNAVFDPALVVDMDGVQAWSER